MESADPATIALVAYLFFGWGFSAWFIRWVGYAYHDNPGPYFSVAAGGLLWPAFVVYVFCWWLEKRLQPPRPPREDPPWDKP